MTPRGAALLLVPCLAVAAGAAVSGLLWVGLALEAAALAVVVLDRWRAPGRSRLSVERTHDAVLSVGRPNVVRLRVDARGAAGARALLRDEHPLDMRASVEAASARLPAEMEYTLTPPRRGERRFGRTVVRVDGPWRLARRQSAVGGDDVVRVDPDLTAVRSFEALARRGQLAEIGLRTLRRPGEGTEFERVRDAVPDDPPRSINWRATARTGRLMASELVPERAQPVVLCIDHGRLMGVGAGSLTKLDHAINAAVLLAHVALRTGDRVGLLAFGDHVTATVAPRGGQSQLRPLLEALRPLEAGSTEADYDEALAHLSRRQRRRALVVLFTDVVDQEQGEALLRQCARLRRRHLPLVVVVRDPALDAAATERPADSSAAHRRAVATGMLADRDTMLRTLRRTGVDVIDADVRSLTPRLVNRYLELKRRARL